MPTGASPPTNVMVTQRGVTSVRVTWTPPSPAGDTTGYSIFYFSGQSTEVLVVGSEGTSAMLTNLTMGREYSIHLVATSQHLPSTPLTATLQLVLGNEIHSALHLNKSLC